MARAATAGELTLFRTPGQRSKLRAAILVPHTIYTAQINQTFSSLDGVLELTYDNGSGTLADALPDMTVLIGSTAGAHDIGIVRLRDRDASKFYIGETSDVPFANDQHLTVIDDYSLWAKQVKLVAGVPYMDGSYAYTDQHTNFAPVPIMGPPRVLKLTGASVSTQFDGSASYCLDSSISAYSWTAPTASSITGGTTATPTIGFNTVGWHVVYLTVTAANGKSSFGVRYVYVWDDDNQPASAAIGDCRSDVESGGWQFDLTLFNNADLTSIRDRSLVILFAEDHYGDTEQSIGPVTGCENIVVTGWIAKESINWNPEQGSVRFTAYTAHYWMQNIPSWPDGVEFVTSTPAAWTEVQDLTVNKGVFHFLHWRSTATKVMDCFLTDNTLLTKEVSSLAQNLWEQLREMAFLQVFARPGVNALNQLYVEVHPQLVPAGSRTWPTVMTITKPDWVGDIDFDRVILPPVSTVDLSGIAVNSSGVGVSYFSRSPGSAHPQYGRPEIVDRVLLESQSQSNSLCGLYYGWRNNLYPDIPIVLSANNRLVDCFPRQKCAIVISEGDTPRGIAYSGNLIPTAVAHIQDPETGYLHTEVSFEAETSPVTPSMSATVIVPGSGDISIPPTPPLPPLPPLPPIIIPGVPELDPDAALPVILHDLSAGLIYTQDILVANPQWIAINAGLTSSHYGGGAVSGANRQIHVCQNGSVYFAKIDTVANNAFLARAPSIGGTFSILYEGASIPPGSGTRGIWGLAQNSLLSEKVAFVMGGHGSNQIYVGAAGSYTAGFACNATSNGRCLSYGLGYWMFTQFDRYAKISPDGSSLAASGTPSGLSPNHMRAGTTGRIYVVKNGTTGLVWTPDNFATINTILDADYSSNIAEAWSSDPTGMLIMGRYKPGGGSPKAKSSDGAASWSALGSLPVGNWWWAYAGGSGTGSRWVAAGGSSVRLSLDFGTTWLNREGNLTSIVAIPNIDRVYIPGYST